MQSKSKVCGVNNRRLNKILKRNISNKIKSIDLDRSNNHSKYYTVF